MIVFAEEFRKALQEEVDGWERKVLGGNCQTFEDYRYKTGYLKGLAIAGVVFEDTLKAFIDEDDDQEISSP